MSEKYVVSQEFMDELEEWKHDTAPEKDFYITPFDFKEIPFVVKSWWLANNVDSIENNNRLIAVIRWLNGEEMFETQKTYKYFVARTNSPYAYLSMKKWYHSEFPKYDSGFSKKKIFDTREEAEKWLVPGYEVMEVEENEL